MIIKGKYYPEIIDNSTTDTVFLDTVKAKYKIKKAKPIYIDTGSVKYIKLPADSAEITKEYLKLHKAFYSTYFYSDTLKNDSVAFIKINTKITQNKPISYDLKYFNRIPQQIKKTTILPYRNSLLIGLDVGNDLIEPNIVYNTKKYYFGAGYNFQHSGLVLKFGINIIR